MANQNSHMANCINVDALFSTLFPQIVPRGTFDGNMLTYSAAAAALLLIPFSALK
jgi:hypothetical protein